MVEAGEQTVYTRISSLWHDSTFLVPARKGRIAYKPHNDVNPASNLFIYDSYPPQGLSEARRDRDVS